MLWYTCDVGCCSVHVHVGVVVSLLHTFNQLIPVTPDIPDYAILFTREV